MSHVTLTVRLRRMLETLPGAVVVATVLPIVVRGGLAAVLAVAAAVVLTMVRRNDFRCGDSRYGGSGRDCARGLVTAGPNPAITLGY